MVELMACEPVGGPYEVRQPAGEVEHVLRTDEKVVVPIVHGHGEGGAAQVVLRRLVRAVHGSVLGHTVVEAPKLADFFEMLQEVDDGLHCHAIRQVVEVER